MKTMGPLIINRYLRVIINSNISTDLQTLVNSTILMSVLGVGLVDSISLPVVPGSFRAVVSLAADRAVLDFTVV
jgi:hypothetical protein